MPSSRAPHVRSVHIVGLGEKLASQATIVVFDRAPGQVSATPVAVVTAKAGRRSAWSTVNARGGVLDVDGRFLTLTFSPPLQVQGDVKVQVRACVCVVCRLQHGSRCLAAASPRRATASSTCGCPRRFTAKKAGWQHGSSWTRHGPAALRARTLPSYFPQVKHKGDLMVEVSFTSKGLPDAPPAVQPPSSEDARTVPPFRVQEGEGGCGHDPPHKVCNRRGCTVFHACAGWQARGSVCSMAAGRGGMPAGAGCVSHCAAWAVGRGGACLMKHTSNFLSTHQRGDRIHLLRWAT